MRTTFLSRYEVKEILPTLAPPKLNKELVSTLTSSVIKRDEYQTLLQIQVGACLNAFGSGISRFLKPEVSQSLDEDSKVAITMFSDDIHFLADHYYRLSLKEGLYQILVKYYRQKCGRLSLSTNFYLAQTLLKLSKQHRLARKLDAKCRKLQLKRERGPYNHQFDQPPQQQLGQTIIYGKPPVRPPLARQTGAHHHKSQSHRSRSRTQ